MFTSDFFLEFYKSLLSNKFYSGSAILVKIISMEHQEPGKFDYSEYYHQFLNYNNYLPWVQDEIGLVFVPNVTPAGHNGRINTIKLYDIDISKEIEFFDGTYDECIYTQQKGMLGSNDLWHRNPRDEIFPFLPTKKIYWKLIAEELLSIIKGCNTNSKRLSRKRVKIWNKNQLREYLGIIGLKDRVEGYLAAVREFQWRFLFCKYLSIKSE